MGRQWLEKNKAITANKRAKITSKLAREITVAAKMGVADPSMNPRLQMAVDAARKQSVSNDVIARAIKKGSGEGEEGVEYEMIIYEGMAPHNVPVLVECMTENRNRTAPEVKSCFKGGQFGSKVAFMFDHVGMIEATHEDGSKDPEEAAIECGANDCVALGNVPEDHAGGLFLTDIPDLYTVAEALRKAGWSIASAELGYHPKDPVALEGEDLEQVQAFLERLDDLDDVQKLHVALK
jgi:YebC/PmpR family DNA-binding regulatory protein